jgi:MerR family transcriptional regulator, copper efflux regulator
MTNFKGFLKVKQAADLLGVTVMTLHRWDAKDKLKALRHPVNNYRLYDRKDLERLLRTVIKKRKKT